MQIYSLNYFLAHKMLMRSILGPIFGVFIWFTIYSTIVSHKNCEFQFLCILLFLEFLMYIFCFFNFCFVLFFQWKLSQTNFQP